MIYLDNNATTKIDERVLEAMKPYLSEEYGNPGSKFYTLAKNAKKALDNARESVASLIGADPKEIIFTSSGSESNNFIVKGMSDYLKYYEKRGNHLITTPIEHKSILNTFKFLNGEIYLNKEIKKTMNDQSDRIDRGYDIDYIDVDSKGLVSIENVEKVIKDSTSFATIILANNETGNVNHIKEISKVLSENKVFFHTDATQAVGRIDIDVKKMGVDALTYSSHKIYGPKGIACLYLKKEKYKGRDITALIHGGDDQEFGYRAGTPALHDIVGFGKAAELANKELSDRIKHLKMLEIKFKEALEILYKDIIFISNGEGVPGVISYVLPNINNQLFIRKVSDQVALSSGSACTISTDSTLLESLKLGQYKSNFFRVSFGKNNKIDDIEKIIKIFESV